jgi:hypothetical protein
MRNALRDRLRDVLLSGDDESLRRLAREAVNGLGRADGGQPGRQSWFTYRVLRALNPETLMASLLEAVLQRPGARWAGREGRAADAHRADEGVRGDGGVRGTPAARRGPRRRERSRRPR